MASTEKEITEQTRTTVPVVSRCYPNGTLIELLYRPLERQTLLALYDAGRWTVQPHVDHDAKTRLVPFSPENNLIKNEVVLLPSEPTMYGSEQDLVSDIQSFIHRYVDLRSEERRVGKECRL